MSLNLATVSDFTVTSRLWPPAATARLTKPGDGLNAVVRIGNETKDLNLDGLMLYNVASIIQRDPAVFGDTANAFVPERWLQQDTADKIPSGAWRAFERGPRNCIGQELALIEARVVVAMVARRYDFVKVGLGAAATDKMTGKSRLDGHGQYEVEKEMYSVSTDPVWYVQGRYAYNNPCDYRQDRSPRSQWTAWRCKSGWRSPGGRINLGKLSAPRPPKKMS